jgi:hypothetical protein
VHRLLLTFSLLTAAISPALADVTACDVIQRQDAEKILGAVAFVKGERINMCAGWCDGINRSYCTFSRSKGKVLSLTFSLSLPPFQNSEKDARNVTRVVAETDNYATDTRNIGGLGETALWSFRGKEGGPSGYLSVFKTNTYHLVVGIDGVADDDSALKDVETIARLAMKRLDRLPAKDRRGTQG